MNQRIGLKVGGCFNGFLWAVVSTELRWGWPITLALCIAALAFGASAARDLAYVGSSEWRDDAGGPV